MHKSANLVGIFFDQVEVYSILIIVSVMLPHFE